MPLPRRYIFTKSGSVVERIRGARSTRYHGQILVAVRRVDTGKGMLVPRAALVPLVTWIRQNSAA